MIVQRKLDGSDKSNDSPAGETPGLCLRIGNEDADCCQESNGLVGGQGYLPRCEERLAVISPKIFLHVIFRHCRA